MGELHSYASFGESGATQANQVYPQRGVRRSLTLLIFVLIVSCSVLIDQLTKSWARAELAAYSQGLPFIPGFMRFLYVENRGAAFGMLHGYSWIFVLAACLVILGTLAVFLIRPRTPAIQLIWFSLLSAGALGNLIDRLAHGFVTDFFATEFIDFPVFNVADICVSSGAILMILYLLVDMLRSYGR